MRTMARRGSGTRARVAFAFTLTIAIALVAMFVLSQSVQAASGPKQVRGYVRDVDGLLINDIPITINIRRASDNTVRATLTDTSGALGEDGYFSQTFVYSDWDIGDTIEVIATHGANQESNSTVATVWPYQWCNVTFPYAIPEFGSIVGFLIAGGLIAAVAVVFLVVKKKK
ncbi:MAG TPA: hypothetical protein VF374_03420 [Thermoplasmata archaeon]